MDDFGPGPSLGHLGEEPRIGAVPSVDGLVRIADYEQVPRGPQPGEEEAMLQGVEVLELVDVDVTEAPPLCSRELGIPLEGVGAVSEEVIEVDEAPSPLLVLVAVVQAGQAARGDTRGQ